jgi:uncharacterized membrane protein
MKNEKLRKMTRAAMLAALVCLVTTLIRIPAFTGEGYINLGDCLVIISGWILGPLYGFAAAGIGSALADLFAGYGVYAPATFVIKGLMAVVSAALLRGVKNKAGLPLSALCAEAVMALGYLVYETFLYGFGTAFAGMAGNFLQMAANLAAALILYAVLPEAILPKRKI